MSNIYYISTFLDLNSQVQASLPASEYPSIFPPFHLNILHFDIILHISLIFQPHFTSIPPAFPLSLSYQHRHRYECHQEEGRRSSFGKDGQLYHHQQYWQTKNNNTNANNSMKSATM